MAKKEKVMVIVLEEFQDKFDHKTMYPTGTELEVDKELQIQDDKWLFKQK